MSIKVLYINLEHRDDRKEKLLNHLKKYNFKDENIIRIDAVLNFKCGHIGCGESHIKALELAIKNEWDQILILEDDFVFVVPKETVEKMLKDVNDIKFDVLLLAAPQIEDGISPYPFVSKISSSSTASGYIVRKHYYNTLLNNYKESIKIMNDELKKHIDSCIMKNIPITKLVYCTAIDQHWVSLQQRDTFYITKPKLGTQKDIFSDNSSDVVGQKRMISLYKKKLTKK